MMDVLEELYPSHEFYKLLYFIDIQPLRDQDWLDVGNIRWNYSDQYYKICKANQLCHWCICKQYKDNIKTRTLMIYQNKITETGKKINGIFYYNYDYNYNHRYKNDNHEMGSLFGIVMMYVYDLNRYTNIRGLDLSETKYVGFSEDFTRVVIDKLKYDGDFLYDIEIYKDHMRFSNTWYNWDEPKYEENIMKLFNVKRLEKHNKEFNTLSSNITIIDDFKPFSPILLTEIPPIYPQLDIEKLIKDPFNPIYREIYRY
jgi:hypothetical protein